MDFKRLRERWYGLAVVRFDKKFIDKFLHPLNSRLAALSPIRGFVMHGIWSVEKRGEYRVEWWEQKTSLDQMAVDFALADLRAIADELVAILAKLCRLSSG